MSKGAQLFSRKGEIYFMFFLFLDVNVFSCACSENNAETNSQLLDENVAITSGHNFLKQSHNRILLDCCTETGICAFVVG